MRADLSRINPLVSNSDSTYDTNNKSQITQVSKEFETLLVSQITKSLSSSNDDDEDEERLFSRSSDLMPNQLGEQMAKTIVDSGGIGIAEMLSKELNSRNNVPAKFNLDTTSLESVEPSNQITRPRFVTKPDISSTINKSDNSSRSYTGEVKLDRLIQETAKKQQVDPYLVAAIIKAESGGRRLAVSSKGACGYMQLMPATFERFAPNKDIFDSRANIEAGVAYVKYLMDKYQGDIRKTLAGYNAGEGNVDKHKGVPPFAETHKFIRTVSSHYQDLVAQNNTTPRPNVTNELATIANNSPSATSNMLAMNSLTNISRETHHPNIQTSKAIHKQIATELPITTKLVSHKETLNSLNNSPQLQLPLQGAISSQFGAHRHHGIHKGVDIAAPQGSPIITAAPGKVVFSGWQRGYGKTVVVEHLDGSRTRYAHAQHLLVSAGEQVTDGQEIAKVGSTGHSTGAHLHFEVIQNNQAVNPLKVLNNNNELAKLIRR